MSNTVATKSFDIPKEWVWRAYQKVKANKGSAGVDNQSIDAFEQDLGPNLYKVWNRMCSGSYMPPPVRQVEIPKQRGGTRKLGIPTVADRVAQTVVKQFLEPRLDPLFHEDSYGYRPGKSATKAVAVTKARCWRYDWVVEFDIKGAFDNIDHGLLMKAVRHHVSDRWVLLFVERWLKAPFLTADGTLSARTCGTPQGGIVSPLLMNLFMHYVFDRWMCKNHDRSPFARYADDAVVHCRTRAKAEKLLPEIAQRLSECGLTLHPDKSKVVYCRDSNRIATYAQTQFTFLGFCFRARPAPAPNGGVFYSFQPAISNEAKKRLRQRIRAWRLPSCSSLTLADLADMTNPVLRGWIGYYGAFYIRELKSVLRHLNRKLVIWAQHKYRRLKGRKRLARKWLRAVIDKLPGLFVHWSLVAVDYA